MINHISISNWKDLEAYGIGLLTGESCAYGLRGLFDLTPTGAEIIASFFGLPESGSENFAEPWNNYVGGKNSVASVMLPYSLFQELALYVLLYHERFAVAVFSESAGQALGFRTLKAYKDLKEFLNTDHRVVLNHEGPHAEDGRNVHQATGRVT